MSKDWTIRGIVLPITVGLLIGHVIGDGISDRQLKATVERNEAKQKEIQAQMDSLAKESAHLLEVTQTLSSKEPE